MKQQYKWIEQHVDDMLKQYMDTKKENNKGGGQ